MACVMLAGVAALQGLHQIVEGREGIVGGRVVAGVPLVEQILRGHGDLERDARGTGDLQRGLLRRDQLIDAGRAGGVHLIGAANRWRRR